MRKKTYTKEENKHKTWMKVQQRVDMVLFLNFALSPDWCGLWPCDTHINSQIRHFLPIFFDNIFTEPGRCTQHYHCLSLTTTKSQLYGKLFFFSCVAKCQPPCNEWVRLVLFCLDFECIPCCCSYIVQSSHSNWKYWKNVLLVDMTHLHWHENNFDDVPFI